MIFLSTPTLISTCCSPLLINILYSGCKRKISTSRFSVDTSPDWLFNFWWDPIGASYDDTSHRPWRMLQSFEDRRLYLSERFSGKFVHTLCFNLSLKSIWLGLAIGLMVQKLVKIDIPLTWLFMMDEWF